MSKKILFLCCLPMGLLLVATKGLAEDPCANFPSSDVNNKCAYLYNNLPDNKNPITSVQGLKQTQEDYTANHTIAILPQGIPLPPQQKSTQAPPATEGAYPPPASLLEVPPANGQANTGNNPAPNLSSGTGSSGTSGTSNNTNTSSSNIGVPVAGPAPEPLASASGTTSSSGSNIGVPTAGAVTPPSAPSGASGASTTPQHKNIYN